ncbi:MAG: serine/threonine-protein kinase [Acidobacteriota bacterium]|nr:serine/threonine-protein kinase [Acidobacteriota bacterium]
MKVCPQCQNTFENNVSFCPRDGQVLQDSHAEMVGKVLDGQYQIEQFIARGGMGDVYRARHILLGDRVVIKTLRSDMRQNAEWLRRFQREGQAARRFRHPNAVTVYDLRTADDGLIYMVMEYVEGRTLDKDLKERRRFSPAEALAVLATVADVLDAAHATGVVHRDLKPENIMIGKPGDVHPGVKLLDLGIAKMVGMGDAHAGELTSLTTAGQVLGTPYYMSPEQWGEAPRDGGAEVDGRTDIYSLGLIAYELVTGQRPYNAATIPEMRRMHVTGDAPALQQLAPHVPEAFSRAITRAMAKDRNDRQATAGEFVSELRAALDHASSSPTISNVEARATGDMPGAAPTLMSPSVRETVRMPVEQQLTVNDPSSDFGASAASAGPSIITAAAAPVVHSSSNRGGTGNTPTSPPTRRRVWPFVIGALIVGVLLLTGVGAAGLLWWNRHNTTPKVNRAPTPAVKKDEPLKGTNTPADPAPSVDAPTANVEALRWWMTTFVDKKDDGKRVAGDPVPMRSGQQFKFHFQPRQSGHLYIIMTTEGNAPVTLLTSRPAKTESNQLVGGVDFNFPGGDDVIELDDQPGTEIFTVIFSPQPLAWPSVLTGQVEHVLTAAEQQELTEFRRRHEANKVEVSVQNANSEQPLTIVRVPGETNPSGHPFIFDIRIEHR